MSFFYSITFVYLVKFSLCAQPFLLRHRDEIETTEATMVIAEIALLHLLAHIVIGLALMIATISLNRLTATMDQLQVPHRHHLPASSSNSQGCELV